MKFLAMLYSVLAYFIGVAALVYLILFMADVFVPVTVNQTHAANGLGLSQGAAIAFNLGLILIWGLQHTYMARPAFKERWTKIVSPAIERSTYMIFVAFFTMGLIHWWQPVSGSLWSVSGTTLGTVLWVTFILGWVITFVSTYLINHFYLFGLQQAYLNMTGKEAAGSRFRTPILYKLVRHPMMLGVLIALWSAPEMTMSRLMLSIGLTLYTFIGMRYEEESLVDELGDEYRDYQKSTPMVLPFLKGKS